MYKLVDLDAIKSLKDKRAAQKPGSMIKWTDMTLPNERLRLQASSAAPSSPRVGQKSVVALRLTPVTEQFLISFLPPLSLLKSDLCLVILVFP